MFSSNSTNNCLPICNYTNPCSTIQSYSNGNSNCTSNNLINCCPSNCYRPLQQLYKTVYAPMCGNNSLHMNIACICRPAERYKTTNMTYGSFYYDNSISTQKNGAFNYDRAVFARCYNNNKNKMAYQSICNNRTKDTSIISNRYDPQENQYWTQSTNDACCPTDCCNNTTNCENSYNNDPCFQNSSTTNKTRNIQVHCV